MKNLSRILLIVLLIGLASFLLLKQKTSQTPIKNVIFIAFDGLQAKHLREYGYPADTTPNLDQFMDGSYLFSNTVSPASWTVPSFISIFTSLYPSEHKVVNKFERFDPATKKGIVSNLKALAPSALTLAEILKQNGYVTGGFTGDAGVGRQFGSAQGFDEYFDKEQFGGLDLSIPQALTWLQNNKDKKFFLFLHGYDVHGQHEPAGGFDYRYVAQPYAGIYTGSKQEQTKLREEGLANGTIALSDTDVRFWRAVYDEKINRADLEFKKFMDAVQAMGLYDNTLFVVFSDHGTEFYEHKRFDHGHTLYGELIDVLLAIKVPGQKDGKKIASLVSTLDIMPTVLGLLSIKNPVPGQTKGIDLTPALTGRDISRPIYFETDYRLYTHKRGVETPDGWKFILTMNGLEKELYNLKNDPGEQNNLAGTEAKKAYELEQLLYTHLKDMNAADGPWVLGCSPVYGDQCQ